MLCILYCVCLHSTIYVSASGWIQHSEYGVQVYEHTIKVEICRVKSISCSSLRFNLFRPYNFI